MRSPYVFLVLRLCALFASLSEIPSASAQSPAATTSVHGCLRPDVEKSREAVRRAIATGATAAADPNTVQRPLDGCEYYMVTFASSVVVVSDAPGEGSRAITGRGAITFGLAPDMSEPEYALTSGPAELTAPVYWSAAEVTPSNGCVVTTMPLPFTAFSFWLAIGRGSAPGVVVQVSPAGDEQHPTRKKCPTGMGGWSPEMPGREMIFTPAWIALHGDGKAATELAGVSKTSIMDPAAMQAAAQRQKEQSPTLSMDATQLQAMADKLKGKQPSPAELRELMNTVVPNVEEQVEAARLTFTLRAPGVCATTASGMVRCSVKRTIRLPDGKGLTQSISESTEITIGRVTVGPSRP